MNWHYSRSDDHGDRRLETVPSLTESERAFLSDAIFNGEDTTTHVMACAGTRTFDGFGGFTGFEMAKLLGPSPESLVCAYSESKIEHQAFNTHLPHEPAASVPLRVFSGHLESAHTLRPLIRSKDMGGYEVMVGCSNMLLLADISNEDSIISHKITTRQTVTNTVELSKHSVLVVYEHEIGAATVCSAEQTLRIQSVSWQFELADKIRDVTVSNETLPAIACTSSSGALAIVDSTELRTITQRSHAFGRDVSATICWNAWQPSQLICTTSAGNVAILDSRCPFHCDTLTCVDSAVCHACIGREQVIVACRGGLVHLLDTRRLESAAQFRDPGIGEIKSLESTPNGKRMLFSGDSGISIWDAGQSLKAEHLRPHKRLLHMQPLCVHRMAGAAW
eukprot:CAMPEP_0185689126 /NCGR_PEP_ID=MMETSP1164-20130828/274_1 /TAXON_ID=1104430 /ORGANISM="Chrysoreinhardia sp, Strain CCMP2950" /LENGTH=391 /DNA_ID=CAMNT_0028355611 /DNA_START=237 /DNA_END=1409 /DNA_ORIENTATION=+